MNNSDTPERLLSDFVHIEFTKFLPADHAGNELPDGVAKNGYLIYNDHRQDFGFGTFRTSDDYTLDADVLEFVKERHADFFPFVSSTNGMYINGTWHVVDHDHIQQ